MSSSSMRTIPSQAEQETGGETQINHQELYQRYANSVSSWPRAEGLSLLQLHRHHQGWHGSLVSIAGAMAADACFAARPSDIVVATLPKSGTTWIKSLLYATVHRREHPPQAAGHPFNSYGPHECVKFLEIQIYTGRNTSADDLDELPDPRLFATHVPFVALPAAVVSSGCKIVYMCRDPKDTLVSLWHFVNRLRVSKGLQPLPVETAAALFCDGMSTYGPYWDHVLGYWRAHLARPDRVLFLRYEEVWRDPPAHVRRLAAFVGLPFDVEEEEGGVVDAIVRLCSFEHMGGLEVTKSGKTELVIGAVENSSFFRRGGVGDWANHLSPEAARRIDAITEARFKGSGLNV
ncbi:cytosolic sulfotransferase 13-like [Panicum virgatum]|nr:cytosolic sulfotransferase 13-like [Panicum virgatum]